MKTGGGILAACGFESHDFRFPIVKEAIRTAEDPAWKAGGALVACGFDSHGFRFGVMVQQEDVSIAR